MNGQNSSSNLQNIFQGQEFEKEILPCSQILYFDVSDETMTARLLNRGKTSGRADDNEETIKKRLDTFHKHSKPVVEAYASKCKTVSNTKVFIFAKISTSIFSKNIFIFQSLVSYHFVFRSQPKETLRTFLLMSPPCWTNCKKRVYLEISFIVFCFIYCQWCEYKFLSSKLKKIIIQMKATFFQRSRK